MRSDAVARSSLPRRIVRRLAFEARNRVDGVEGRLITMRSRWPCPDPKYLLVGSESSGTSAVSDLLFVNVPGIRVFREGARQAWSWEAYKSIYQGNATIRDYPRLQLFDAIKVPGFAMIIGQFRVDFPNTRVLYMVRDPRDFVSSAYRTWRSQGVDDPSQIPWVTEEWLGIPNSDPVERLCLRWKAYLRSAIEAGGVVFVRYEDFCADKAATIRDLSRRLDLPFNENRVNQRKDIQVSRARHYEPQGPGSWRTDLMAADIETIERLCADEMAQWRYGP